MDSFCPQTNRGDDIAYIGPEILAEEVEALTAVQGYNHTLENKGIEALLQDQRSKDVVGGFVYPPQGGVIIMVPRPPYSQQHEVATAYCNALDKLGKLLVKNRKSPSTGEPDWAKKFFAKEEKDIRKNAAEAEETIAKLRIELDTHRQKLEEMRVLNALYYESGDPLVDVVKNALGELGFTVQPGPKNEADLVGHLDQTQPIAFEIKGENKGASKDNISQAEGWARDVNLAIHDQDQKRRELYRSYQQILSQVGFDLDQLQKRETRTKAVLILNTYRKSPLNERTDPSFPDNLHHEMKHRDVCGLTTLQLLGLVQTCRKDPAKKQALVKELMDTTGQYPHFRDWTDFLETQETEE